MVIALVDGGPRKMAAPIGALAAQARLVAHGLALTLTSASLASLAYGDVGVSGSRKTRTRGISSRIRRAASPCICFETGAATARISHLAAVASSVRRAAAQA